MANNERQGYHSAFTSGLSTGFPNQTRLAQIRPYSGGVGHHLVYVVCPKLLRYEILVTPDPNQWNKSIARRFRSTRHEMVRTKMMIIMEMRTQMRIKMKKEMENLE